MTSDYRDVLLDHTQHTQYPPFLFHIPLFDNFLGAASSSFADCLVDRMRVFRYAFYLYVVR